MWAGNILATSGLGTWLTFTHLSTKSLGIHLDTFHDTILPCDAHRRWLSCISIAFHESSAMEGYSRSASRQSVSRPVSATPSAPSTPRSRPALRASSLESSRKFAPNASIVLVGIRGCGKTSLGYIAARALGRRLVESDDEFERKTGCTRAQFLKRNGQNEEEYRLQERQVMESMLVNYERDAIITCGVGSLETVGQALLKRYALTHPVVHVIRGSEYIRQWLRLPKGSKLMQRLEESDRSHRLCSNFEFYNYYDGGTSMASGPASESISPTPGGSRSPRYTGMLQRTQEDFVRFLNLIMGFNDETLQVLTSKIKAATACPIDRVYTYALRIYYWQLDSVDLAALECGADAIEIEVLASDVMGQSLAVDSPWISKLSETFALLRRKLKTPIIFHVNHQSLLQSLSTSNCDELYLELLYLGLRMGTEFLTVDIDLEEEHIKHLRAAKGSSMLIGYFEDLRPTQLGWDDPSRLRRHTKATRVGCDIIRISQTASVDEDNISIRRFKQQATFKDDAKPLMAYNLGRLGRVSFCYNSILTPVTHPLLRQKPKDKHSWFTLKELSALIYDLGLVDPLQYFLFGANIEYSLSPALHNAGYAATGLPHTYQIYQTARFSDIELLLQDPSFGGCSVSLPYKIEVPKRASSMSVEAQAIGACNTIIPIRASQKDGRSTLSSRSGKVVGFHGENTDWISMFIVIRRNLSPANQIRSQTTGLVIGAGGMARAAIYALMRLDVSNILIYNRTVANAEKVAAHFREVAQNMQKTSRSFKSVKHYFTVIKSLEDSWPADLEQPTIIISCVPAHQIGDSPAPNLNIPISWLQSVNGGVIVEVCGL